MWERIISDIVLIVFAAVVAYFRGKMSERFRVEVLRVMRVIEKTMESKDNSELEDAAVDLFARLRGGIENVIECKVRDLIRNEAANMKPLVKVARIMLDVFQKGK